MKLVGDAFEVWGNRTRTARFRLSGFAIRQVGGERSLLPRNQTRAASGSDDSVGFVSGGVGGSRRESTQWYSRVCSRPTRRQSQRRDLSRRVLRYE